MLPQKVCLHYAYLLRASVVDETSRKAISGISGISLAILGDRMRTKNASPRTATSRAESRKPRKGYAMYWRRGPILACDSRRAPLPFIPAQHQIGWLIHNSAHFELKVRHYDKAISTFCRILFKKFSVGVGRCENSSEHAMIAVWSQSFLWRLCEKDGLSQEAEVRSELRAFKESNRAS